MTHHAAVLFGDPAHVVGEGAVDVRAVARRDDRGHKVFNGIGVGVIPVESLTHTVRDARSSGGGVPSKQTFRLVEWDGWAQADFDTRGRGGAWGFGGVVPKVLVAEFDGLCERPRMHSVNHDSAW